MQTEVNLSGDDRRYLSTRLTIMRVVVILVFSALAVSFWYLQIVQHRKFEEMAENNHQRLLALRAPRGVVFDRNGKVLVENRYAFNISLMREHTKDLNASVAQIATLTGLDERDLHEIVNRHRSEPKYRPLVLVEDA